MTDTETKPLTLAALLTVSLMLAACHHGDSPDDRFIAALNSHSIPGDRGVEITAAHEQCDALRHIADIDIKTDKNPPMSVLLEYGQKTNNIHDRLTTQGLSLEQFMQATVDAADTLCPDVKDSLKRLENMP